MSEMIRRKLRNGGPALITIYGPPGVGKTSAALSFPDAVIIPIEDGVPRADVDGTPLEFDAYDQPKTYEEFLGMVNDFAGQTEDEFKNLVIDSADLLEALINDYVCRANEWPNIEEPGYGKGYIAAQVEWHSLMQLLRDVVKFRKANVIIVAHSDVVTFTPPGMESFNRYAPRLNKRAANVVQDQSDIVGFLNFSMAIREVKEKFGGKEKVAVGGEMRLLNLENRAAHSAKNRAGMPPQISINPKQHLYPLIAQYLA